MRSLFHCPSAKVKQKFKINTQRLCLFGKKDLHSDLQRILVRRALLDFLC